MSNNVFIFVPGYGQMVSASTLLTTHAVRDLLTRKGIGSGISTLSFPDISELRSIVTTIWYDTMPGMDYILFIDNDMGFPPEIVLDMVAFGEPVVGAIYRHRRDEVSWAASGSGSAITERMGDFMKLEGIGMGCALIHRSAIPKMLQRFPELIDYRIELHPCYNLIKPTGTNRILRLFEKMDIPERGVVSEDLAFCIRWRQCGGTVWANIAYPISHVGPKDFAGRYLDHIEGAQQLLVNLRGGGATDFSLFSQPAQQTQIRGENVAPEKELTVAPYKGNGSMPTELFANTP